MTSLHTPIPSSPMRSDPVRSDPANPPVGSPVLFPRMDEIISPSRSSTPARREENILFPHIPRTVVCYQFFNGKRYKIEAISQGGRPLNLINLSQQERIGIQNRIQTLFMRHENELKRRGLLYPNTTLQEINRQGLFCTQGNLQIQSFHRDIASARGEKPTQRLWNELARAMEGLREIEGRPSTPLSTPIETSTPRSSPLHSPLEQPSPIPSPPHFNPPPPPLASPPSPVPLPLTPPAHSPALPHSPVHLPNPLMINSPPILHHTHTPLHPVIPPHSQPLSLPVLSDPRPIDRRILSTQIQLESFDWNRVDWYQQIPPRIRLRICKNILNRKSHYPIERHIWNRFDQMPKPQRKGRIIPTTEALIEEEHARLERECQALSSSLESEYRQGAEQFLQTISKTTHNQDFQGIYAYNQKEINTLLKQPEFFQMLQEQIRYEQRNLSAEKVRDHMNQEYLRLFARVLERYLDSR